MSFDRLRQRIVLKCVLHVQHDYFSSFNQSDHCFLASSSPLTSSLLKPSVVSSDKRQLISLRTSSYANNSCFSHHFRFTEYMGCFTILVENRIFVSSPGDYNLQDISPLYCLRQCGKKYRYATLQEGNICLCADSLPTRGQVDDSECDKPCPGHQSWPSKDQASLK